MHRSLLVTVIAVIALLTTASPSLFAQDVLPSRPAAGAGKEIKQQTEEAIDRIAQRWEEDRNPRVIVIVGIQHGDRMVYGQPSQMVNRIISPLKRHLRDAIDDGIVIPSYKQLQDAKVLDRLARDAGDGLSDGGSDVLKKQFDADLIIDLTMLDSTERGRLALNMAVIDTREGVEIASDSLRTVAANITESHGVAVADAIIRSFAKEYAPERTRRRPKSKTFEFKLLGIEVEDGISQGALRDLATRIEEASDKVKWAETDFVGMEDTGFAQMKVRYVGRQRDLLNLIESRVLSKLKTAWRIQQADGTVAVVYLFPNDVPVWFSLTNPKSPDFEDTVRRRNAKLSASGLPKLGIVVGEDFNEPLGQFKADGGQAPGGFEAQALEGELQSQFTNLGFRVVESSTLRDQLKKQLGNAKRYENLSHMQGALADLESVDLVLHINIVPGSNGTKFNARLFDVARAEVIGFQTWPNDAASRLGSHRVNSNKPEEVARYVTGQLLNRYDRYADRALNTLDVQVRNVTDAQQILALVEQLKENVKEIRDVADVQAVSPAASFELVYSGQKTPMILSALDVIGGQFPGTEAQVLGNTLVVNLEPVTKSEEQLAAEEAALRQELEPVLGVQDPDPTAVIAPIVVPSTAPATAPITAVLSDNATFGQRLLQARASVYIVGLRINDDFRMVGTGWQVVPGILATNAHVVMGLHEIQSDLVKNEGVDPRAIEFVALAGPAHDKVVVLRPDMVIHPLYKQHEEQWSQYLAEVARQQGEERAKEVAAYVPVAGGDVGLMRIARGEEAQPLTMADQTVLEGALNPADTIAYIGFPAENLMKITNLNTPAQQIDIGNIMSVTDFDSLDGTPKTRQLIHYDLITAGGASGSPVFNQAGQVIAVNSAGSYIFVDSSVSSSPRIRTGVAYGQRVDLVRDLLDGKGLPVGTEDFDSPANRHR